jgi:protein PET100, fungi type
MFPIGIMYYFGTNLDERFSVPDFWPKAEHANRVPMEKDEIQAELARLRARRLHLRDKRLEEEAASRGEVLPAAPMHQQKTEAPGGGWYAWLRPGDAPKTKE